PARRPDPSVAVFSRERTGIETSGPLWRGRGPIRATHGPDRVAGDPSEALGSAVLFSGERKLSSRQPCSEPKRYRAVTSTTIAANSAATAIASNGTQRRILPDPACPV